MHSRIWNTLLFTAMTVTAIPQAPIQPTPAPPTSNQQPPSTLPVELGQNISFPDYSPNPADTGNDSETNQPIVIPVSSSVFNLVFSDYSSADQPAPQNIYAAMVFIQRLFKDKFFNVQQQLSITTPIADPVIDVKTLGVWLHVENTSKDLRYSLFTDLLAYITYISISFQYNRSLFQLVNRTSERPVYTGWIGAANLTYEQQFSGQ